MSPRTTRQVAFSDLTAGLELGPSAWIDVDQSRVDAFAAATDDHQWIHVDPERAADGPFGQTIAHGWLALSLLAPLTAALLPLGGRTTVNYGADRVRFPSPLPTGSRVRATLRIDAVERLDTEALRLKFEATVAAEGAEKPVCVASLIYLIYPTTSGEQ